MTRFWQRAILALALVLIGGQPVTDNDLRALARQEDAA